MRPRIGITATRGVRGSRSVEQVNRSYVEAVLGAGALPFLLPVLPPSDSFETLTALDALLLSGGGDIDPSYYGMPRSPMVDGVDAERDEWELALLASAFDLGLPVLGICRGAQLINVAAGGTLVPHLPDITAEIHRSPDERGLPSHAVRVQAGSRVARVLELDMIDVNSLHHQAVAQLGAGLSAVAWSHDGVTEAIETHDRRRAIGVQWHPELLTDRPGHHDLFGWLVREASGRAARASFPAAAPELSVADAV
jgi:gamma-glutamyl-gamma-aminobutyrate hydrolase PuuD